MNRIDGSQTSQLQSQRKQADAVKVNNAPGLNVQKGGEDASATTQGGVTISAAGRQLNELEQSMTDKLQFDRKKVELVKQAIDDGTYKPNVGAIARNMLDFEQSM